MMVTVAFCLPRYLREAFKHHGALTEESKQDARALCMSFRVLLLPFLMLRKTDGLSSDQTTFLRLLETG